MQFIIKCKDFKTGQSRNVLMTDCIDKAINTVLEAEQNRSNWQSVLYIEDSQGNKAYSDATGSLFKVFPNLMYQMDIKTLKKVKSRAMRTCHSGAVIHQKINKAISEKVVFNVG